VPVGEILEAMRQGVEPVLRLLEQARLTDEMITRTVEPLAQAMVRAGVNAAGPFTMRFDLPDERAVQQVLQLADVNDWLRFNVSPEQREQIGGMIRTAFMEGGHPYETARLIVQSGIGPNSVQAGRCNASQRACCSRALRGMRMIGRWPGKPHAMSGNGRDDRPHRNTTGCSGKARRQPGSSIGRGGD